MGGRPPVVFELDDIAEIDWERRIRDFEEALEEIRDLFAWVQERRRTIRPHVDEDCVYWLDKEGQEMLLEQLQAWRRILEPLGGTTR